MGLFLSSKENFSPKTKGLAWFLLSHWFCVPPHGLRKLKVTSNQFPCVRFTRFIQPFNFWRTPSECQLSLNVYQMCDDSEGVHGPPYHLSGYLQLSFARNLDFKFIDPHSCENHNYLCQSCLVQDLLAIVKAKIPSKMTNKIHKQSLYLLRNW